MIEPGARVVAGWLLFSLPTLIAFSADAIGFPRFARHLYSYICKYRYAPAMHYYGLLLVSFEHDFCDVEQGKAWIRRAAEQGYTPSVSWLKKYGGLTQDGSHLARELLDAVQKRDGSEWWGKWRPYIWLTYFIAAIFAIVLAFI